MEKLPMLAADLITELDAIYPERCPTLTTTEREIFWYAGQRELVRNLKSRLEQELQGDDDVR